VDLARGLTVGHLDGGGEALLIFTVEGRESSNKCAEARVGRGEVAAEDSSTVDVNVAEGASAASVADQRHCRVGESGGVVMVVVLVVVVVVFEWVEHLIWLCVMV
jgi:hypothetical protein